MAHLTWLVCLWTLTLAPAFATFAPLAPLTQNSAASSAIGSLAQADAENDVCRCAMCGAKKGGDCCCKGKGTTPGGNCVMRSLCDTATRAINLPFTWWVAMLPVAGSVSTPQPAFIRFIPLPLASLRLSALPAAPDIPPRFLS